MPPGAGPTSTTVSIDRGDAAVVHAKPTCALLHVEVSIVDVPAAVQDLEEHGFAAALDRELVHLPMCVMSDPNEPMRMPN